MKKRISMGLLAGTVLGGSLSTAFPAYAQEASQPADATVQQDGGAAIPSTETQGAAAPAAKDIVITGTRIPQPNLTSASPVTVLSSQEVKLAGTTRTEDLINSLPQSFASQGSNISNGSTGTATINLRGLGSNRTLVLVNGRRLQPGDPRNPVADINFIPASIVKRVDVLTGGASSVYGADAVSGVVNFIMDTNFTGLRIDAQASTFMHYNDVNRGILDANTGADRGGPLTPFNYRPPHGWSVNGGAQDISAAFGTNFDDGRGHITAYATYRKQDPVLEASRDYSFCALAGLPLNDPRVERFPGDRPSVTRTGRNFNCGGSATSATGTFFTNIGTFQTQGNQFVPGSTPFNFGPYNYFQRPDERYTFGTFAEYEISPGARPYLEAMFLDDQSVAQIAPSGDFFNTNTINCDNPLLSAQQLAIVCQQAVYDPTDATNFTGNFNSTFGNLVGGSPIFGPDPDGAGPLKAPLLGFNTPTTFTDALGNTYNQGIAYIGRRNVEGGGRRDSTEHLAFRIVAGIKGDLLPGLSYDAYYQFGTTRFAQTFSNDFSVSRLNRALDVVANPAVGGVAGVAAGTPVCRSALPGTGSGGGALDPSCVPYNVFQTGGVTPQALAYLQIPLIQRGHVNETIADANFTLEGGEYGIQTPWADRGVGLNVGVEYRKEALLTDPDASFQAGDGAGQGAPTLPIQCDHGVPVTQGGECGFSVREGFAELQVPIVSHSFIDEFTLTGGYRYSDYKVAGRHFNTDTYKVEARLAPIPDILARASYNRAVRAPNAVELFTQPFVGLGGTSDVCAGSAVGGLVNGFTAAQCAFTGVTATQFGNINANPANQYNARFGGNTELTPETADTYTVGVLLKPRWIPGLAFTVDYFDIRVKDLISTLGFQTILSNCVSSGDPFFCGFIHRNPNNGSLWQGNTGFIDTSNLNIGGLRTKGIDLNGNYSHRLTGIGTISANYVATILRELQIDGGVPPVNPINDTHDGKFDCAGFYGPTCGSFLSGAPNPKYRHALRLSLTLPNGLGISGRWRYFSSVRNDATSHDCDLGRNVPATEGSSTGSNSQHCGELLTDNNTHVGNFKIPAQSYFDLTLTARLADKYNFRLGATNIFDKEPPIVGGEVSNAPFGNGNTFPQVYDALGRYVFAGVTVDF